MKKDKRAKRMRGAEKNNVTFAVQCPECGAKIHVDSFDEPCFVACEECLTIIRVREEDLIAEPKKQHESLDDLLKDLDKDLEEAEGGTHCVFFTLIIRVKSLERAYEEKPDLVEKLLAEGRFFLNDDGTISESAMAYHFGETVALLQDQLDLKKGRDFFILDGSTWYLYLEGIRDEDLGEKFEELFPELSKYFDFVKVLRSNIVIRLKDGPDELVQEKPSNKELAEQSGDEEVECVQEENERQVLAEIKKRKMQEIIKLRKDQGYMYGDEFVHFVHYEDMFVCSACGGLYGSWKYEPEIKPIYPKRLEMATEYQDCYCDRRYGHKEWPGFDINEIVTLCHCCGREVLNSGSRWSVWFCQECKESVITLNTFAQRTIIPIGRHSMMAGYQLKGQDIHETEKIENYAANVNQLFSGIDHLDEWRKCIIGENFKVLEISKDISLVDYLVWVSKLPDKNIAFQKMCSFFIKPRKKR